MKNIAFFLLVFSMVQFGFSQEKFSVYNPEADAKKDIENTVELAKNSNKHVLIQIGGNWCSWCKLFHDLTTTDEEIKTYLNENYVVYHLNFSKENKNLDVLASLDYPQRFGFPVFVILNQDGKRIHTQSSGYLEEGKGHSKKLILEFLQNWSPSALNPELYTK